MSIGLLILRLAVGLTLAYHGTQKLFGWFGGHGLEKTAGFMQMMGFVPGKRAALAAGAVETFAGLFLALGLTTPAAAALLFSVMLVATVSVHLKNGFSIAKSGYEYTLVLGLSALSLAFIGPGRFSLDALLGIAQSGATWGAGALLVGAAGAALQLAMRKLPSQASAPVPAPAK
jgi:putative oxidoreductase